MILAIEDNIGFNEATDGFKVNYSLHCIENWKKRSRRRNIRKEHDLDILEVNVHENVLERCKGRFKVTTSILRADLTI